MSTEPTETFQVPLDAAEAYEATFVPALFADWAPHVVSAAGVGAGQSVLDVACGTGIVARAALERVGPGGRVTGLDLNGAMLTVARRREPAVDWRQGDACDLPFADGSFDVVVCQSALMFLPDRAGALREMARVVASGGTVAVQVWRGLDAQPAYGPLVAVAARHAGPEAVRLLGSYWSLGDPDAVRALFEAAGLEVAAVRDRTGTARFPSLDALVRTEVESTPLVERISDEVYRAILADAREALAAFRTPAGRAEIPIAGYIVTGRAP
jgi:SAM-dependent methyltransferase